MLLSKKYDRLMRYVYLNDNRIKDKTTNAIVFFSGSNLSLGKNSGGGLFMFRTIFMSRFDNTPES